jgi:transcription initiation factor TFIIIB Brf1 subunit/transcription initiation factor TFIIB
MELSKNLGNIDFDIDNLDNINFFSDYFEGINFNQDIKEDKSCVKQCPECNSFENINNYTTGYVTCVDCGQAIDNILDANPEWRQYEDDGRGGGDIARCSQAVSKLIPQSSTGTRHVASGYGKLQKLQNWNFMPYRERSLNDVFKLISSRCEKFGIKKNIQDDAKIIYKSVNECTHKLGKNKGKPIITRGKNRLGIIGSCVFLACRKNKLTYLPKEIADIFTLKHTELNRGCKSLLKLLKARNFSIDTGTSKPEHFINRYCNLLHIRSNFTEQSLKIVRNIEKLNLVSEHTPFSIAATAVLVMAEVNKIGSLTKKKIAEEFNISEVTITKTYKKIELFKNILSDDNRVNELIRKIDETKDQKILIPKNIFLKMKKFGVDTSNIVLEEEIDKFTAICEKTPIHELIKLSKTEKNLNKFKIMANIIKTHINKF